MIRQQLGALFITSTLVWVVGCATKIQAPIEEEKVAVVEQAAPAVVEQTEPAVVQAITDIQQEQVSLPPLESIAVYFYYDSSEIKSSELSLIDSHATYLTQNPDQVLVLEGHADERGSDEYNKILGQKRANSVMNLLFEQGVSPRQMRIMSYGESQPKVLGKDEAAWSSNRRVEFVYELTDKQQTALNLSTTQTLE